MSRCVLHISGDFPDGFQAGKTPVIKYLVDELSGYGTNIVISINRVSRLVDESIRREGNVFSIRYFSPQFGLLHAHFLDRLALKITRLLERSGISPDIAIGHKFTIESWLAWRLAQRFNIPYVAAFMGNSDRKIYRAKPHYRSRYREIASKASALIFPTYWCREYFSERLLGRGLKGLPDKIQVIPYISSTTIQQFSSAPLSFRRFIVICRLDVWRIKNIHRLIEAIGRLRRESQDWQLDIVGSGLSTAESEIKRLIAKYCAGAGVRLLGGMTRAEIDSILPHYSAMVMPSYPESFGLVYLEALAQGVPIMTAKDSGFDGFFANGFPGVVVSHTNTDAIVSGLRSLAEQGNSYRALIADSSDEFVQFDRNVIVDKYRKVLSL